MTWLNVIHALLYRLDKKIGCLIHECVIFLPQNLDPLSNYFPCYLVVTVQKVCLQPIDICHQ